jgi:hypothetical protein
MDEKRKWSRCWARGRGRGDGGAGEIKVEKEAALFCFLSLTPNHTCIMESQR